MSNYNGRHGPNVSQYLRDLNVISPQDTPAEETFNMEDNLSLFTNTQFFDFDSGENTDFHAHPVKVESKTAAPSVTASEDVTAPASVIGEMPNLDFMSNEFGFSDFNNAYAAPSMNSYAEGPQNFQSLSGSHGAPVHLQQQYGQASMQAGDKRKSDSMASSGQSINFEDVSRKAADDEKRKRNTAASARFRIKKKQREQALEKSAKEMTDKVTGLENRVSQLETENKWLKNLLVEKNEGNEDISALWKEFTKQASDKLKTSPSDGPASDEITVGEDDR